MAENYVIEGYKAIGREIWNFGQQNKAHIMTGLGVAGTITTGVFAARGGARAARKIDRRERELNRSLTFKEKFRLCAGDFVIPVVAGGLAITGTITSDVINTKEIGEKTALLIASEKAYEQLERKTREVVGEKKNRQIQDEIAKENVADKGPKDEEGKPYLLTKSAFDNAPKCGKGVLYPYVDEYSMLPFWSNPDYIALHVKCLREMMAEQPARGDEYDYYDKEVGVHYSEWLKGLNYDKKTWDTPERKNAGWNKGFVKDGSEDDPIEYSICPIEYEEGFPVNLLRWEKNPINMKLGRLIKSNGVGL